MNADRPPPQQILEEDLHAFVDNALDPARRREVQAYVDRHPEAALQVSEFLAQRQALRAAIAPVADEPVPPRLNLARLLDENRTRQQRMPWRMAAAVLLAFSLGSLGGWSLRDGMPQGGGLAALAREASNSYAVYAADPSRPVEMGAGQQSELVSWVSGRLQHQVAVPDLSLSGYRFIGGRLVATGHGPAGLFVYESENGTRLAMLVRPMARERDTPMMKHSEGSIAGYAWADRGLGYSVVGSELPEVLHPLADEARRQIGKDLQG